jgi:hypothetical protein
MLKQSFYWNPSTWELKAGCQDPKCYRVPLALIAPVGPVFGGIYFISMPLIGLCIIVGLVLRELARPFANLWKLCSNR